MAEPLDAIVLALFFVAVALICLHNWLSDRKVRDDDSYYIDPASPRLVQTSSDGAPPEAVSAITGVADPGAAVSAEVVASAYRGTTRLSLVTRRR
jgi:hypothetical protein